jgi:drug/metabolite transporter (DMT)-like permease
MAKYTDQTATIELVFAGMLWGFGFIATLWALHDIGPFTLTPLRFLLAAGVSLPLILFHPSWRRHLNIGQARLAFWPGFFLFLTLTFQTWGLKFTTATKSGFITTLYILFVPILERLILKRHLHRFHWLFVASAMAGTALICQFQLGNWNVGDGLTLLCAFAASFQILWFGLIADRIESVVTFNFWQTLWAFALAAPLMLFESGPWLPHSNFAWAGLLLLAFGSTLIAFALQIRAQRVLSPSVASLLFLLESPFATLFAIAILNERLDVTQWVGAGLILFSGAAASWLSTRMPLHTQRN